MFKFKPLVAAILTVATAQAFAAEHGPSAPAMAFRVADMARAKTHHPKHHSAFASDPEGNNTEAVCHRPE